MKLNEDSIDRVLNGSVDNSSIQQVEDVNNGQSSGLRNDSYDFGPQVTGFFINNRRKSSEFGN